MFTISIKEIKREFASVRQQTIICRVSSVKQKRNGSTVAIHDLGSICGEIGTAKDSTLLVYPLNRR
jgi:hypothetical protein